MARSPRRIILWTAAGLMAGLVVLLLAIPLWFPWLLRPAAEQLGARYQRYERQGFRSFHLQSFALTNEAIAFQAGQVTALLPTTWLWRKYVRNGAEPYLAIEDWHLRLLKSGTNAPGETSTNSVYDSVQGLEAQLSALDKWLPKAVLSNGTIESAGQIIRLPQAVWTDGVLEAQLLLPKYDQRFTLRANLGEALPYRLQLDSQSLNLHLDATISESGPGLEIASTATWLTNRLEANARFSRNGLLPETATLEAKAFRVPANQLKLPAYQDLEGSLSFRWAEERFQVDLSAEANPKPGETLPPIAVDLHAAGDTNSAVLERARVAAPGIELQVSRNVPVQFTPPFLTQETTVNLALDLSRQPWLKADGQIEGKVLLRPGAEYPTAAYTLSGTGITITNLVINSVQAGGRFQFPWLELGEAKAEFGDGSTVTAQAALQVQEHLLRDGRLRLTGAFGRPWWPEGFSYQNLVLGVRFQGPLTNVSHSGQVQVTNLVAPNLEPLQIAADWRGQQLDLSQAEFNFQAGESLLSGRGSFEWGESEKRLELSSLKLQRNGQPELTLEEPFRLTFSSGLQDQATNAWTIRAQPFRWTGTNRLVALQATVEWPRQGRIEGTIRDLNPKLFEDFFAPKLPPAELDGLNLAAGWTNGPVNFHLGLAGQVQITNNLPLEMEAEWNGSASGISLDRLLLSIQQKPLLTGQGLLPLTLQPGATGEWVNIQPEKPLRLELATWPNAAFWSQMTAPYGLSLKEPALRANLSGTWKAPQGRITLEAAEIALTNADRSLPPIQQLRAAADLNRDEVKIEPLQFRLANQPVLLTASLPLGQEFWTNLTQGAKPDLDKISARLEVPKAQLAALAPYAPELLSPQGELSMDVTLLPGRQLDGSLQIRDAGTRPLPSLGPVRKIDARLAMQGRRIDLETFSASLAGQPLAATGAVVLSEQLIPGTNLPVFELNVRGTNVPLVRKAEVMIRADLNVSITNSPAAPPPVVTGEVRMHDSYFLSDLGDLIPGQVARPSQRPPYFSIEAEPFSDWRLNLRVRGEQFLKVRSPLFRGEVSTTLKLEGTLQEPVALGEIRIDNGTVPFPFATFHVTDGLVSLTSENPHAPQLFVTATARRLGYDIRLEVTGPASSPTLQFSSSPPLSPEQILLMVTAGQAPTATGQLSTQQRAQRLGMFLGKNLLSQLGIGGGDQERLTIQSGEQVTETGKPTYEVEYKLNDKWSVVGEYDRFSDFNVGLKWNVLSK